MTITETKPEAAEPKVEYEFKRWVPTAFSEPATTPVQVLIYAHALLLDEERWMKGEWYNNAHPEVDPEDPFCNDWKVCAAGALAMVAVGAGRQLTTLKSEWDDDSGDWKGLVACPVPKERQTWQLILDKPENGDAPEGLDVYEKACGFLRHGAIVTNNRAYNSVPGFNDDSMTTRTDVLKAFVAAIEIATRAQVEEDVRAQVRLRVNDVLAAV